MQAMLGDWVVETDGVAVEEKFITMPDDGEDFLHPVDEAMAAAVPAREHRRCVLGLPTLEVVAVAVAAAAAAAAAAQEAEAAVSRRKQTIPLQLKQQCGGQRNLRGGSLATPAPLCRTHPFCA